MSRSHAHTYAIFKKAATKRMKTFSSLNSQNLSLQSQLRQPFVPISLSAHLTSRPVSSGSRFLSASEPDVCFSKGFMPHILPLLKYNGREAPLNRNPRRVFLRPLDKIVVCRALAWLLNGAVR
jgi:hypothetical protein